MFILIWTVSATCIVSLGISKHFHISLIIQLPSNYIMVKIERSIVSSLFAILIFQDLNCHVFDFLFFLTERGWGVRREWGGHRDNPP